MQRIFPACLLFLLLSFLPATAQEWDKHRQAVLGEPSLIRYHVFDGTATVPNLAPAKDVENSNLVYKTEHPFEAVAGPFEGTKAARIDAGWFEGPNLGVDKAFSVEMRVRLNTAGTEKGNSGYGNGTLYGLGNGYDNGIRLTTDCPRQSLTFSIGRPENPHSRNAYSSHPVPYGVWMHVATTWDGKTMRIYVDGMLYAIIDYDGVLTEPCWGFRVGFNDAGVGSVKMDVAEVAVYKNALQPEEVLAHALLQPKFPPGHAALLHSAIDAVLRKDFTEAMGKADELLSLKMPKVYQYSVRKFKAELAAMTGHLSQTLRLSAVLLNEPDLPPNLADGLMRRLISTEHLNPPTVASSAVYRKILDDKSFNLTDRQRFAVEKCYATALFAEGNTAEAKKLLDGLSEREREFNREDLAKQNLSAEFTDLYKNYRETTTATVIPPRTAALSAMRMGKAQFFVAPDGKAENSGTEKNKPFGSLTQARDAIRRMRSQPFNHTIPFTIEINVLGGVYPVTETFALETQDGGTNLFKIVYRAAPGETPIFSGGVSVTGFKNVDDPNILKRLPIESRDKILVATISGDVKFPPAAGRGYGKNGLQAAPGVEMFIDDKPQQIARWPNVPKPGAADMYRESENSFVRTGKVHRGFFDTPTAGQPGIFEYSHPRHERWTEAKDALLYGYWGHLWSPSSAVVAKVDTSAGQVVLATGVTYGIRENMPYYAFNLLEEIDEPGEWYLDRENGKLYVYPPNGVDLNAAKVRLSCFPKEFITAKDVSHTALIGLHFEEGTGNGIRVEGGEGFHVIGCSVKRFGNWGIGITGTNHAVLGCDLTALGGGGIDLGGGDVRTLTPGNCVVENTFVNDFSRIDRCYAPAVALGGVGNRLAYNLFCDSPGHAIRIEGMEHVVEFNEVHSIVYETDDQAGIDIWGNPFIRGMVFRYNYWHHCNSGRECGSAGIRLDDMISSVLMYGNVFFRTSGGNFGGIQIHGGKDNIVDGNLMIDCKYAMSYGPWGEKRWLEFLDKDFGPRSRHNGYDPDSEIYKTKYPDYAELKLNADRNIITRNAAIACDVFACRDGRNVNLNNVMIPWMSSLFTETQGMGPGGENRVAPDARKFHGRLSIPMDSPVYELLGIPPIPVDSMGLYLDEIRREIPKTEITPFFVLE